MKKSLLAFCLISASGLSQAQTLTTSDVGTVGSIYYQGNDAAPASTIMIGAAASGQTWDFSTLVSSSETVISIVSPNSTPYSSLHPGSNLCMLNITGVDTIYAYANNTTTLLEVTGLSLLNPITNSGFLHIRENRREKLLSFPTSLGTSFYNTSSYKAQVSGASVGQSQVDSVRMRVVKRKHVVADGSGDVITPDGTFNNCLRLYTSSLDSTYIDVKVTIPFVGSFWQNQSATDSLSYQYDWWTPTFGYTVATLKYDSLNDVIMSAQYGSANPLGTKVAASEKNYSVYPVPAKNEIFFASSKATTVTILDITGRVVLNGKVNSNQSVDVSSLPSGIYSANIKDTKGVSIGVNRIVIED